MKLTELLKNKFILTGSIFVLLLTAFLIYKTMFYSPIEGVSNSFYKDRLYVYETVTKAFEEERELTVFEKRKIEDILEDFTSKPYEGEGKDDRSPNELLLDVDIYSMYARYDLAMGEYGDKERRAELLSEFQSKQKTAKAALGIR